MKRYVDVIVEISTKSLDRPFTYEVPASLRDQIEIGSIVTIPFGVASKERSGYVIGFPNTIEFDSNKLKQIKNVNDSISIESELIKLAFWMRKRYGSTLQAALKTMIPTNQVRNKKYDKMIHLLLSEEETLKYIDEIKNKASYSSRISILSSLIKKSPVLRKDLLESTGVSASVLNSLEKRGMISINDLEIFRNPYDLDKILHTSPFIPNESQENAIQRIKRSVIDKQNDIFLLHGITGSGKTEVYMQVIDEIIRQGRQAIVLIPEISLTPQMVNGFIGRFGDVVGVSHSRLSQGERYDQWRKAKEGKISIMIGPRSAIFTPFDNLGIIIIDEEHEPTYKSETTPRYHAREVAIKRANMQNCPLVLGSATPLIETYYKAKCGKYGLIELKNKANENAELKVDIVDMRKELEEGNKTILSHELRARIEEALKLNEQIILFINRRGHSTFVSCRKCGYVMKCNSCDIPYTYHSREEKLICHYCGHQIPKVKTCPDCGSKHIKEFGIGTQKVENYIRNEFKDAKILRMDFDTTMGKKAHEKILECFYKHEADILIGTQMVAKGHHFENVTLVGVIAADLSLYMNDYRACERTFQLITQVTGRAGRGQKAGHAIIQTYSPDHYSILCSKEQDYIGFYHNEIQFRKLMAYPPFKNIGTLVFSSKNEKQLIHDVFEVKELLINLTKSYKIDILGPTPANLSKLKNQFRWRIILKYDNYNILSQILQHVKEQVELRDSYQHMNILIDMNSMVAY